MSLVCSHSVALTNGARVNSALGQYWSARDCYGEKREASGESFQASYWSASDCGGKPVPRPSGYASNALCECRVTRRLQTGHVVDLRIERLSYADYGASEECGCTQNATGVACW